MSKQRLILLSLTANLTFACSPTVEVDRNRQSSGVRNESAEANGQNKDKNFSSVEVIDVGDTKSTSIEKIKTIVKIDGTKLKPLANWQTADISALPVDWMANLQAVHKVSPTKTIFYGKDQRSWIIDEDSEDLSLREINLEDLSLPPSSAVYVTGNELFWLINEASISFPIGKDDQGQIQLGNIEPALMQNAEGPITTSFVSAETVIITSEKKANIVTKQANQPNSATIFAINFPEFFDHSALTSAGVTSNGASYWFATSSHILFLEEEVEGEWSWVHAQITMNTEDKNIKGIAWTPSGIADRQLMLTGSVQFLRTDSNIYSLQQRALEMFTPPSAEELALRQAFDETIMPLLTDNCINCHAGYDQFATAFEKSTEFRLRINDATNPMPPVDNAEQFSEEEKTQVSAWLMQADQIKTQMQ